MGMDYYLESDNEYESDKDFPEGLSYFFEQLGGYGETSMVAQVSEILGINLDLFQQTYYEGMEDDYEEEELDGDDYWIDLGTLQNKVQEFIAKIEQKPDYYREVKFEGKYYPEDTGYLSGGNLLHDLRDLAQTLSDYKQHGSAQLSLVYG